MTADLGPDDKAMRLRYGGACRLCGAQLVAGAMAVYELGSKTVRCVECATPGESISGTAGASARREYERRKHNREERIRTSHPKLGGFFLAVSSDPQSTQAWEVGAVGEELMARRLATLPETFRVLHDRRIPGTRVNIDHMVVGPTGVWVIDAKRYRGKRPTLQVDGGVLRPRRETLRVAGRDRSKLVEGVQHQVAKVAVAIGSAVPVRGVLCFLEADWPLIGGSFEVDGIHVLWPHLLMKKISEAPTHPIDVDEHLLRIAGAFPRA